jgi:hypothetical protein
MILQTYFLNIFNYWTISRVFFEIFRVKFTEILETSAKSKVLAVFLQNSCSSYQRHRYTFRVSWNVIEHHFEI